MRFAQTERIVSGKFYVAPTTIEGGYVTQQHAYEELSNPKTRFGSREWTLFRHFDLPSEAGGIAAALAAHPHVRRWPALRAPSGKTGRGVGRSYDVSHSTKWRLAA